MEINRICWEKRWIWCLGHFDFAQWPREIIEFEVKFKCFEFVREISFAEILK